MYVNLIFKVRFGATRYSSSVEKNLAIIPDKIGLRDGRWIFDKTSGVTFFPHDEKLGRACYDVEYSIIADTTEEAQEILREIDSIY